MKVVQVLTILGLLNGLYAECYHEWSPFRDVETVKGNGVSAGFFKHDVPAYVGQENTETEKGRVPGRIKMDKPLGIYYTTNMKVVNSNNQVEFLKKNDDYEYKWVDASGNKCIVGGVMVDDTYYIGRFVGGNYSYLGRVDVGQRGLKYENFNGLEVITNQYEVLTCTRKKDEIPDGEEKCEDKLATSEQKISELNATINNDHVTHLNCERLLNETQDKNIILKRLNTMLEKERDDCKPNQAIQVPTTTCPTPNITEYESEITKLKEQAAKALKKASELIHHITTLTSQNDEIKKQFHGVEGCIKALQSVTILNADEQKSLMKAIMDKLSREDRAKMNS